MKLSVLLVLAVLAGCATPVSVTPKPDVTPVKTSVQATRVSIGKVRGSIKESQTVLVEQGGNLDKAAMYVDKLLEK